VIETNACRCATDISVSVGHMADTDKFKIAYVFHFFNQNIRIANGSFENIAKFTY
jgi:hypothetical protein